MFHLQGLYGALFIKLNLLWTRLRKRRFKRFPLPLIEVGHPTYIIFIGSSTYMFIHACKK